jgi:multicomponent Na+:H+ antiporter subunit C
VIYLAAALSGVLVACGLYLLLSWNAQRVALGFLLFSNGANLVVLTSAGLPPRASPPLLGAGQGGGPYADPLAQAFILTAIVIGLGMAAFLLAMAAGLHLESGSDQLRRIDPRRRSDAP